jgi:hypothetical protein
MNEISQPYARELARQVDELEVENARLRAALVEIRDHNGGWATEVAERALKQPND